MMTTRPTEGRADYINYTSTIPNQLQPYEMANSSQAHLTRYIHLWIFPRVIIYSLTIIVHYGLTNNYIIYPRFDIVPTLILTNQPYGLQFTDDPTNLPRTYATLITKFLMCSLDTPISITYGVHSYV